MRYPLLIFFIILFLSSSIPSSGFAEATGGDPVVVNRTCDDQSGLIGGFTSSLPGTIIRIPEGSLINCTRPFVISNITVYKILFEGLVLNTNISIDNVQCLDRNGGPGSCVEFLGSVAKTDFHDTSLAEKVIVNISRVTRLIQSVDNQGYAATQKNFDNHHLIAFGRDVTFIDLFIIQQCVLKIENYRNTSTSVHLFALEGVFAYNRQILFLNNTLHLSNVVHALPHRLHIARIWGRTDFIPTAHTFFHTNQTTLSHNKIYVSLFNDTVASTENVVDRSLVVSIITAARLVRGGGVILTPLPSNSAEIETAAARRANFTVSFNSIIIPRFEQVSKARYIITVADFAGSVQWYYKLHFLNNSLSVSNLSSYHQKGPGTDSQINGAVTFRSSRLNYIHEILVSGNDLKLSNLTHGNTVNAEQMEIRTMAQFKASVERIRTVEASFNRVNVQNVKAPSMVIRGVAFAVVSGTPSADNGGGGALGFQLRFSNNQNMIFRNLTTTRNDLQVNFVRFSDIIVLATFISVVNSSWSISDVVAAQDMRLETMQMYTPAPVSNNGNVRFSKTVFLYFHQLQVHVRNAVTRTDSTSSFIHALLIVRKKGDSGRLVPSTDTYLKLNSISIKDVHQDIQLVSSQRALSVATVITSVPILFVGEFLVSSTTLYCSFSSIAPEAGFTTSNQIHHFFPLAMPPAPTKTQLSYYPVPPTVTFENVNLTVVALRRVNLRSLIFSWNTGNVADEVLAPPNISFLNCHVNASLTPIENNLVLFDNADGSENVFRLQPGDTQDFLVYVVAVVQFMTGFRDSFHSLHVDNVGVTITAESNFTSSSLSSSSYPRYQYVSVVFFGTTSSVGESINGARLVSILNSYVTHNIVPSSDNNNNGKGPHLGMIETNIFWARSASRGHEFVFRNNNLNFRLYWSDSDSYSNQQLALQNYARTVVCKFDSYGSSTAESLTAKPSPFASHSSPPSVEVSHSTLITAVNFQLCNTSQVLAFGSVQGFSLLNFSSNFLRARGRGISTQVNSFRFGKFLSSIDTIILEKDTTRAMLQPGKVQSSWVFSVKERFYDINNFFARNCIASASIESEKKADSRFISINFWYRIEIKKQFVVESNLFYHRLNVTTLRPASETTTWVSFCYLGSDSHLFKSVVVRDNRISATGFSVARGFFSFFSLVIFSGSKRASLVSDSMVLKNNSGYISFDAYQKLGNGGRTNGATDSFYSILRFLMTFPDVAVLNVSDNTFRSVVFKNVTRAIAFISVVGRQTVFLTQAPPEAPTQPVWPPPIPHSVDWSINSNFLRSNQVPGTLLYLGVRKDEFLPATFRIKNNFLGPMHRTFKNVSLLASVQSSFLIGAGYVAGQEQQSATSVSKDDDSYYTTLLSHKTTFFIDGNEMGVKGAIFQTLYTPSTCLPTVRCSSVFQSSWHFGCNNKFNFAGTMRPFLRDFSPTSSRQRTAAGSILLDCLNNVSFTRSVVTASVTESAPSPSRSVPSSQSAEETFSENETRTRSLTPPPTPSKTRSVPTPTDTGETQKATESVGNSVTLRETASNETDSRSDPSFLTVATESFSGNDTHTSTSSLAFPRPEKKPKRKKESQLFAGSGAALSIGAALAGPSSFTASQRAMALLSMSACPAVSQEDVDDLEFDENPTGVEIGVEADGGKKSDPYRTHRGALVMNSALLLIFLVLGYIVSLLVASLSKVKVEKAEGRVKFPGAWFMPAVVLSAASSTALGALATKSLRVTAPTDVSDDFYADPNIKQQDHRISGLDIGLLAFAALVLLVFPLVLLVRLVFLTRHEGEKLIDVKKQKEEAEKARARQQQEEGEGGTRINLNDRDFEIARTTTELAQATAHTQFNKKKKQKEKEKEKKSKRKKGGGGTSLEQIRALEQERDCPGVGEGIKKVWNWLMEPIQFEWKDTNTCQKYGPIYDAMKFPSFAIFDFFAACLIGILSGIASNCPAMNCCRAVAVSALVIATAHLLFLLVLRPMLIRSEVIVTTAASIITFVEAVLITILLFGVKLDLKYLKLMPYFAQAFGFAALLLIFLPLMILSLMKTVVWYQKMKRTGGKDDDDIDDEKAKKKSEGKEEEQDGENKNNNNNSEEEQTAGEGDDNNNNNNNNNREEGEREEVQDDEEQDEEESEVKSKKGGGKRRKALSSNPNLSALAQDINDDEELEEQLLPTATAAATAAAGGGRVSTSENWRNTPKPKPKQNLRIVTGSTIRARREQQQQQKQQQNMLPTTNMSSFANALSSSSSPSPHKSHRFSSQQQDEQQNINNNNNNNNNSEKPKKFKRYRSRQQQRAEAFDAALSAITIPDTLAVSPSAYSTPEETALDLLGAGNNSNEEEEVEEGEELSSEEYQRLLGVTYNKH